MSLDVLVMQVKRLYENYNSNRDDDLIKNKVKFIQREIPNIEARAFSRAVDEILRDENIKRFPSIAQIKSFLPRQQASQIELNDCDHCRSGLTPVWQFKEKLNRHYQYSYACPFCDAGKAMSERFPYLPDEYRSIPYETLRSRPAEISRLILS